MTLTSLNQYGNHFQIKVLSSLLTHKEFLTNIALYILKFTGSHNVDDEEEKIINNNE